jgi:hypothetical protein
LTYLPDWRAERSLGLGGLFSNVELGYKTDIFQLGITYTSYTGYAQYCNHVGFVIGLGI